MPGGSTTDGNQEEKLADPVSPALDGDKSLVDAVAPPSTPAAESSRRPRGDVKEERDLALKGSKSDGFGL